MWARWSRFVVERPLDPVDLIALDAELTVTARASSVVGHHAMLDATRRVFAILDIGDRGGAAGDCGVDVSTIRRVLGALAGQTPVARIEEFEVRRPPGDLVGVRWAESVQLWFEDGAEAEVVELGRFVAARSRAWVDLPGYCTTALLVADPARSALLFRFWGGRRHTGTRAFAPLRAELTGVAAPLGIHEVAAFDLLRGEPLP